MLKKVLICFLVVVVAFSSISISGRKVSAADGLSGDGGSVVYSKADVDNGKLLKFTPGETGSYIIYSDNIEGEGMPLFRKIYDDNMNEIPSSRFGYPDTDNFWSTMFLTGGKTYYFQMGRVTSVNGVDTASDDFKFTVHISKYEMYDEGWMTNKGGGDIIFEYQIKERYSFDFTPENSGYYAIWTSDPMGKIDPSFEITDPDGSKRELVYSLIEYYHQVVKLQVQWFNKDETYNIRPYSHGTTPSSNASFNIHICPINPTFADPGIEYQLVDPNKKIDIEFDLNDNSTLPFTECLRASAYTDFKGEHADIKKKSSSAYSIEKGVDNFTFATFEFSQQDIFDFRKVFYIFVMPESADGTIVPGKVLHFEGSSPFKTKAGGKIPKQWIYSYTPDKSGTIKMTSSNIEMGYPTVALFNASYDFMASAGGDEYLASNELLPNTYDKDSVSSVTLEAHLDAGKTYYFAFPLINYGLTPYMRECVYSLNNDWNVEFTEDKVQPAPETPSDPVTPVTPSTTGGTFEDFVERLYVVALGRASEPDGKAHWCKVVGNGSYSGADCARFFLTSPEFKGRNLNNEEFLKVLYKTFFDRDAAADPDGFNFWLSKIDEWGRERVIEGFIDSTEWCNICASYGVRSGAMTAKATIASKNATAFATRLYTECLGRDPEEGGLKYWSLSLTNQERTGTPAAKEFFYSEEFIGKGLNDNDYVTRFYKTFMGREPDDAGKAHWLNQLSSGSMNRDQVFDFFSTCEEFTDICNQYAIAR